MASIAIALPGRAARSRLRVRARTKRTHFPVENTVIWVVAFALYVTVSAYLVFHMHYMIDDAYARIDNAFDVLFTSDPHLAAIGFFWPPLPSFLELPIIAFKNVWPPLVTQGFAGCIEASAFGAGTVVLFNSGLKWAGVVRGMRYVLCAIWLINPMIMIYSTQGMSEGMFVFFFVASILVFLRWSESGRTSLLPLMGVLVGLDVLCRNEAVILAVAMMVAVIAMAVRRRSGWREIETVALLFGLPLFFVVMLWVGTAAVIMHDPLYVLHTNGVGIPNTATSTPANAAPAATSSAQDIFGAVVITNLRDGAVYVLGHSFLLFPAVVPLLAMLGSRFLVKKNRLPSLMLLAFGLAIPLVDILRLRTGLGPYIRYQIAVIPFTMILAVYVLRSVRGKRALLSSWLGLALVFVLGASNVLTAETLSRFKIAQQEAPLILALSSGKSVPEAAGVTDKIDIGAAITPKILALDTDGGRILCDSTTCFPIILNAPNPSQFVVTSDRQFQAALAQPQVYGVEYFLMPGHQGQGQLDALNQAYPALWEDGAGFATLVGGVDGDSWGQWRLYRITGPTGRG